MIRIERKKVTIELATETAQTEFEEWLAGEIRDAAPTPTDFARARCFGASLDQIRAYRWRVGEDGYPEFDSLATFRYPLGPRRAVQLRDEIDAEQRNLRTSLARHAERLPELPERDPWRPEYRRPEYLGGATPVGILIAAYLLGPQTPVRLARLSAWYGWEHPRGEDHFAEFLDALLPEWRTYRNDFDKQERAGARRADLEHLRGEDEEETNEEVTDRLTGGSPDFAPALIRRLAYRELDPELLHRRDVHPTLTGAQKTARSRLRGKLQREDSLYFQAQDASEAAGASFTPSIYRKPAGVFSQPRDPRDVAQWAILSNSQRARYYANRDAEVNHLRGITERGYPNGIGGYFHDPFTLSNQLTYPSEWKQADSWSEEEMPHFLGFGQASSVKRDGRVFCAGRTYRVLRHRDVSHAELERRRFAKLGQS
jgi:hypothetical protein